MIARKLDHAHAPVRGPVIDRKPNRECERVEPHMAARPGRSTPADCSLTPQHKLPAGLSPVRLCLPEVLSPRSLPQTCRKHFGIGLMFLVNSRYHVPGTFSCLTRRCCVSSICG